MKLFYRRYGKEGDQPLVILHGLFGLSDNWDTLSRKFAETGLDVVAPDLRNHGRSGHSDTMLYEAMSDDLLELIDDLNLRSVHLLGHSMGGKVSMQFARDYPDRIGKLVIADISPEASGNRVHDRLIGLMCSAELEKRKSRKEVEDYLQEKIENERIRKFLLKNLYWKDKSTLGWRMNLKIIRNSLDEIFKGIDFFHPYEGETLFLRGELSDYIPEKSIPRIKEIFLRARVVTINNGTHWLHADNPEDFAREVVNFLSH